jgi:hypothetical protein
MRDADAELKMLADNGIHLDIATEQAYRAVLANENAAVVPPKSLPQQRVEPIARRKRR